MRADLALSLQDFKPGDHAIEQGAVGDYFYIVKSVSMAYCVIQQSPSIEGSEGANPAIPQTA